MAPRLPLAGWTPRHHREPDCSSSLFRTTRLALHRSRVGEGCVHLRRSGDWVSNFQRHVGSHPDTNLICRRRGLHRQRAGRRCRGLTCVAASCRRLYPMGQTAGERRDHRITARAGLQRAAEPRRRRRERGPPREHARHDAGRHGLRRRRPSWHHPMRRSHSSPPSTRRHRRRRHRRPLNDGAAAW